MCFIQGMIPWIRSKDIFFDIPLYMMKLDQEVWEAEQEMKVPFFDAGTG